MNRLQVSTILALIFAAASACSNTVGGGNGGQVVQEEGRILIEDETGKRWDVTHAQNQYGLRAENFQFGLGPNAIRPILNPQFLNPGDPGYPAANASFLVIGTTINQLTRAYPISVLSRHEVTDELFDSTYVAVAY